MSEIENYCKANGIEHSKSCDSYYFVIGGVKYRVSNHSVESSTYTYLGDVHHYHGDSKEYRAEVFCIHASKTRIIEIHKAIQSGKRVNHNGNII